MLTSAGLFSSTYDTVNYFLAGSAIMFSIPPYTCFLHNYNIVIATKLIFVTEYLNLDRYRTRAYVTYRGPRRKCTAWL